MGGLITIEDSNNHEVSFTPKDGASPRTVTIPDNVPDLDVDNIFIGNIEAPSMSIGGEFVSTHSFKNKIINGMFDIWQRGTSTTTGGMNSVDRFESFFGPSGVGSVTRDSAGVNARTKLGTVYALRHQITTAPSSPALAVLTTKLEHPRSYSDKTFTFSTAWSGITSGFSLTIKAFHTGGSLDLVTPTVLNTDNQDPVSVTFTVPDLEVYTFDDSSYIQINLAQTVAETHDIYFGGMQLEEGSASTPFEQRPIGYEDSLCKRYYQTFYLSAYSLHSTGRSNSASVVSGNNTFLPIRMRTTPTITQSATISDGAVKGISLSYSGTGSVYVTAVNPYSIQFRSQGASLVNGAYYAIGTNATGASAYLDAEL